LGKHLRSDCQNLALRVTSRRAALGEGCTMRRKGELGQAIVAVALALVVLLGMLGLGIDFGYFRYMKRQMQTAADAAAVAGSGELDFGDVTSAAQAAAAKNGFTNGTNGVTVDVYNPPTDEPAGQGAGQDPHNGKSQYVSVVIKQNQPTFFAKVFGVSSVLLSTRAEGAEGGGNNCMYALDPNGSPAVQVKVGIFLSNCGIVDESSNPFAFECIGIFDSPYIGVVGGNASLCIFGEASPTTGIKDPNPTDPLAYRQATMKAAAPSTCGTSTASPYTGSSSQVTIPKNTTVVLNPGKYCGGIVINNAGANVTFNPGVYTLSSTSGSNGGLTIGAGTAVNGGGGVAFYNEGPNGGINFMGTSFTGGTVTLTAPTSGPFEGILFFQDPNDTAAAQVFGSSTLNVTPTGSYYFPSASIAFAFDAVADYNDIVAKDIAFGLTINSTIIETNGYDNYSSLANGSPIKGGNGVLVE
jgi:Putative Flp pilus-assembly TadE/G-like